MAHTVVKDGMLVFDFGDGSPPLMGRVDGKLDRAQAVQWCNSVRGTWRARQDSKEAEEVRKAEAISRAPKPEDRSPEVPAGSGLPIAADGEDPQAALAAGIEATLAELDRRAADIEGELAASLAELDRVTALRDFYRRLRKKVSASKVRRADSNAASHPQVEARVAARRARKVVRRKVPEPDA